MIEFIKPYFDNNEYQILQTQKPSIDFNEKKCTEIIHEYFGKNCISTASGEDAIKAIIQYTGKKIGTPSIAIPDVICASVYRATKGTGPLHLMDTDYTWNCIYDNKALESDILLFASLSGKRKEIPSLKTKPDRQILIEDACQCYDGISGFRETDYSVFSFSKGKQMYAGGGGMIVSKNDLSDLSTWMIKHNFKRPQDWQIELIASQAQKINEINNNRIYNGSYLIEKLKDVCGIMLPEEDNHVFLKFIIFIKQSENEKFTIKAIPGRSRQIFKFMHHMMSKGVQVEETYIPIHVRFPEEFPEEEYKGYNCDHTWIEAITLPCRPDLTHDELDQIVDAVRSFDNKRTAKQVFSDSYDTKDLKPAEEGYFKDLFDLKLQQVIDLSKKGDKILDIGCGAGDILMLLYDRGKASGIENYVEISGVDFTEAFLDEVEEKIRNHPYYGKQPHKLYHLDVTNMDGIDNDYFDIVFSFAVLYYIEDIESVVNEMYRILKPGGYAVVEFGNKNSLGNYESGRVSTNVEYYHKTLEDLEALIDRSGLIPIKRRCFQIFPLYGGFHNGTSTFVVPLLRHIMSQKNKDGIMLDELVSSSPFINQYSFRQFYVLKKDPEAKRYDLGSNNIKYIVDDEAIEFTKEIFEKFSHGILWKEGVNRLVNALMTEPNNALLVYTLMCLHPGIEEKALSEKFFKEVNLYKKQTL